VQYPFQLPADSATPQSPDRWHSRDWNQTNLPCRNYAQRIVGGTFIEGIRAIEYHPSF
jgi:hypothetical protein